MAQIEVLRHRETRFRWGWRKDFPGFRGPRLRILLLLASLVYFSSQGWGQVVLSEILFDPATSEQSDEFVEIVNLSTEEWVDLSGWRVGDDSGDDGLIDAGQGLMLGPGQYAVILDGDYHGLSTTYDGVIPPEALVVTIDGTALGDAGLSNSRAETVVLLDATGCRVSAYTYSPGNREGYSDEKVRLEGGNTAANWMDSLKPGGTPGAPNSVMAAEAVSRVHLGIIPNPFSPNGDGDDDTVEFRYTLPALSSRLSVTIYTLSGRRVRDVACGVLAGSQGTLSWDGRDDAGCRLPQGLYVVYLGAQSVSDGVSSECKDVVVLAR